MGTLSILDVFLSTDIYEAIFMYLRVLLMYDIALSLYFHVFLLEEKINSGLVPYHCRILAEFKLQKAIVEIFSLVQI